MYPTIQKGTFGIKNHIQKQRILKGEGWYVPSPTDNSFWIWFLISFVSSHHQLSILQVGVTGGERRETEVTIDDEMKRMIALAPLVVSAFLLAYPLQGYL